MIDGTEEYDLDDKGRIIYMKREADCITEEWWYEYDEKGNKICTKYMEEVVLGDTYSDYI
jgi:hypothetical protein